MCGIVGIVDFDAPVEPRKIRRMADIIAYRGPDGEGYWHDERAALGIRRLAIVDVENGDQPVGNETRSVQVVFNGEIYNHEQLRGDLARRGHRFRSHADTEVIPHLYEEHGDAFVEQLDGVFAIALWDAQRRRLLLARDRVGVKPLFYSLEGRSLIFASGDRDIAVDPQGLSDCFFYTHPIVPGTFWVGIQDMEPGTTLAFDGDGPSSQRYFTPMQRLHGDGPLLRGRGAVEAFAGAFEGAVRKRLPNEVKGAITLSGGLDSSAVAAAAARLCDAPLPAYSIRMPGEDLDEGSFSRYVARDLGVENNEVAITGQEACKQLPRSIWHMESPQWFGAVAAPFLRLSEEARKDGVKVALSGDGADELLGGYDFYRLTAINQRLSSWGLGWVHPLLIRNAVKWIGAPSGVEERIGQVQADMDYYSQRYGEVPAWIYLWSSIRHAARPLLKMADLPSPSSLPPPPDHDPLHRKLHFEYVTRLPSWTLVLSDRLGMANSIEIRVPFMDRALLALSTELSSNVLSRWGTEKYVLRQAVRGYLPERIRTRRKKPFFTPIAAWYLSGPGRDLAGAYLSEPAARRFGIFDARETEALWNTALQKTGTWEGMVAEWVCLMVMSTHILVEQFTASRLVGTET